MFDICEQFGNWWLPASPDIYVSGMIKLHQGSYYSLTLDSFLSEDFNRYDVLVGEIRGQKLTLFDVHINTVDTVNGKPSNLNYRFQECLIGAHYSDINEISFDNMNANLGIGFVKWFGETLKITEIPEYYNKRTRSREVELGRADGVKVSVLPTFKWQHSETKLNFEIKCILQISCEYQIGFSKLLQLVNSFSALISILSNNRIIPHDISFVTEDQANSTTYFPSIRPDLVNNVGYTFITHQNVKPILNNILEIWFRDQDKFDIISYVLQRLLDSAYNVPIELQFTQIAQVTEVFHRRFFETSNVSLSRKAAIKPYFDYLELLFINLELASHYLDKHAS